MPTTFYDQFYNFDPAATSTPVGTPLNVVYHTLVDFDDDGLISANGTDTVNGFIVTAVWEGDVLTVNVPGTGDVTYTGTTFYVDNNGTTEAYFTPTNDFGATNQTLEDGTYVSSDFVTTSTEMEVSDFGPACFTPGTFIATPKGDVRIETIAPGDLILTQDHGPRPVRKILQRTVAGIGNFAPVEIAAGVLGNRRSLLVSPQHRMLMSGWQTELAFGTPEVLIAAKHLVGRDGIVRKMIPRITYIHLVMDTHEIVFAEGAPTESFFLGDAICDGPLRTELVALFPDLAQSSLPKGKTARSVVTGREARALLAA